MCWKNWKRNSRSSMRSFFKFDLNLTLLPQNAQLMTRQYYQVQLNTFQTHLASSLALCQPCRRSLLAALSRVNLQPCNLWLLRPRQPHWMLLKFPRNCFTSLSSSPPAVLAHTGTPAGKTLMYTTPVLFFLVTMDTWSLSALSQLQFGFEPHPKTLPAKFHSPVFFFSSLSGLFTFPKTSVKHESHHFKMFLKQMWFSTDTKH